MILLNLSMLMYNVYRPSIISY